MYVQARKGLREPKLVRTLDERGGGPRLLADYFSAAYGAVDGVDDGAVVLPQHVVVVGCELVIVGAAATGGG